MATAHDFRLPITDEGHLKKFVELAWGMRIPDRQVCEDHSTPWRAFADAYFAHPSEIVPFMEQADLETLALIACEGLVYTAEDHINDVSGDVWEAWVELNYRLGKDPCLHGASCHLLYVGRKGSK